jgi:glucan phosphoethanolaminetransferase (alkaline phosphatase superfamily)
MHSRTCSATIPLKPGVRANVYWTLHRWIRGCLSTSPGSTVLTRHFLWWLAFSMLYSSLSGPLRMSYQQSVLLMKATYVIRIFLSVLRFGMLMMPLTIETGGIFNGLIKVVENVVVATRKSLTNTRIPCIKRTTI